MTKSEKAAAIDQLKVKFDESQFFYVTDSSTLTVAEVNELRGLCFKEGIEMRVVKNTLAIKALEAAPEEKGFQGLIDVLKGPSTIMFSDVANKPAKIIEEFRKSHERPILKAAYIDADVYVGDDQVKSLASLKSKEDLIGDVIMLLQSPMKTLVGQLNSGGNSLSGILKALENRG